MIYFCLCTLRYLPFFCNKIDYNICSWLHDWDDGSTSTGMMVVLVGRTPRDDGSTSTGMMVVL